MSGGVLCPLGSVERVLGVGQPASASVGQPHRPVAPLKEGYPDEVLQLSDRFAERLLGEVQPTRGTGEAELLGNREEVAEVSQLNRGR